MRSKLLPRCYFNTPNVVAEELIRRKEDVVVPFACRILWLLDHIIHPVSSFRTVSGDKQKSKLNNAFRGTANHVVRSCLYVRGTETTWLTMSRLEKERKDME